MQLISCEGITDFSDTLTKGKIVIICDNAFHAGGTVYPESPNLRLTVLSEEWEPKDREPFGLVRPDNGTDFRLDVIADTVSFWKKCGYAFVPKEHPEWVTEIVSIRKGEWLPKRNDYACGYSSKTGISSSWHLCDMLHDFTEEKRGDSTNHYFPSAKQRDTFISQHKKESRELYGSEKFKQITDFFTHFPCELGSGQLNRVYDIIFTHKKEEPKGTKNVYTIGNKYFIKDDKVCFQRIVLKRDSENYTDETDVRYNAPSGKIFLGADEYDIIINKKTGDLELAKLK